MGGKPPMGGPAPAGMGPAAGPGGMAGNQMAGLQKVQIGVKALIDALPMLPLGSEIQSEVMKAVQSIGKHVAGAAEGGDHAGLMQQLALMGRQAKANPMQAQALDQMGGGGAPPPGAGAGAPPLGG